jgi:hypothetical protein
VTSLDSDNFPERVDEKRGIKILWSLKKNLQSKKKYQTLEMTRRKEEKKAKKQEGLDTACLSL